MGKKEEGRKQLAVSILQGLGGENNILVASHCYTRLRLTIKDTSKVNDDEIKGITGVLGLIKRDNEYQVVIGPDVSSLYLVFAQLGNFETEANRVDDVDNEDKENKTNAGKKNYVTKIFDFIAGTFSPIIPVLIAGGLTGAVLTILTNFFGVTTDSGTYIVFYAINQAAFYFLPIFIGFTAAKKLQINSFLGAFLGAILLYSTINGAEGLSFLSIPIKQTTYNTTVFPILLGVAFMAVIYKFFEKLLPKEVRTVFLPLITMIITVPITLLILGPLGGTVGNYISAALYWLYQNAAPVAVMIIGACTPLLVFFGMNNALYPIVFALFAATECDPLIVAGMLSANIAIGTVCIAVGIKSKNPTTKGVALSAGITGLLGITEPAVYGVLFPMKKPLIAAMIGGGVGGLLCGILKVAGYAIVSPSLVSIVAFIPNDGSMGNFYGAIAVTIVSIIVSFASAWILGINEKETKL